MIRRILAVGVSVAALAAALPAAAQEADRTPPPQMTFGTWGVDPAALDQDIKPGDDFFAYVNEKWLEANPLTPEFARYGAFDMLREKSTSDVETLVRELVASNPAPGTQERRIVDAFNAF
jgi:putative endopeptidase